MEHLPMPTNWKESFTKYPHGLTIFEAICKWVVQVDLMIDHLNLTDSQVAQLFTDTLPENVENVLNTWYDNGKLETILNINWGGVGADLADVKKDQVTISELIRKYPVNPWLHALDYKTLIINQSVIKSGTYPIPEGQTIIFVNNGEIVQDDDLIAILADSSKWAIEGTGKIRKNWTKPLVKVAGSIGIKVSATAFDWSIGGNIRVEHFADSGVLFDGANIVTGRTGNTHIENLHCFENWDNWAFLAGFPVEYLSLANCLSSYASNRGVYEETGNINWNGGAIIHNSAGLHLRQPDSGANAHHGMFTGVHINHNSAYQLWAEKVAYGHDFIGCHFYDNNEAGLGRIKLDNCRGINILGGTIGCDVAYINDGHLHVGYNRIAGNKIDRDRAIITGAGFDRTKLFVEDNFDNAGAWGFNDVARSYAQKYQGSDKALVGETVYNLVNDIGSELSDNRNALGASFITPFKGNYITTLLARITLSQAVSGEYITFERDDSASGTFTELYRVNLADIVNNAGTSASLHLLYEFIVSKGGQVIIYLKGANPATTYTVKTGALLTIKTNR